MAWRIVFVCTGNICRSPTAEGVLRRMVATQGLADHIEVASAGLEDWHAGAPPDARSQAHAQRRGHGPTSAGGFEVVLDLVEAVCEEVLAEVGQLCE